MLRLELNNILSFLLSILLTSHIFYHIFDHFFPLSLSFPFSCADAKLVKIHARQYWTVAVRLIVSHFLPSISLSSHLTIIYAPSKLLTFSQSCYPISVDHSLIAIYCFFSSPTTAAATNFLAFSAYCEYD